MAESAREGAIAIAQRLRRLARTTLGRLGVRPQGEEPYKPVFPDRTLALRLGISPPPSAGAGSSDSFSRLACAGARRARELIGPRFFVDPRDVNKLTQELEAMRPGTIASLMSRVDADATNGIPVYALQGPALGAGFPWRELPPGPVQDQMYAKRPHRFAFVPRNALACLFVPAAAKRLDGMLEAWMRHAAQGSNPLCYDSNLGVIQRILALSWGWAFLAGRPAEESPEGLELEWRILQIVEADIRFLEPLLGRSAPNNHLLADWFAGWYLRTVFPELLENPQTGDETRWCDELLGQTYPDGGSFEHSSHYHEFACEMGVAYLLLSKRNGSTPTQRMTERVRALLAYQCALTGPKAHPLPIGNAIEDTLFPLDPGEGWCAGSLRELYRALFDADIALTPNDDPTFARAFWMLGGDVAPPGVSNDSSRLPMHFPQAGLHILADDALKARLVFRTGPSPDHALAAGHMHSDLLAFYVDVDDQPYIVDAGTYSYRRSTDSPKTGPDWRAYFAGPNAHNVLSIPDADPLGPLLSDFRKRVTSTRVTTTRHAGDGLAVVEAKIESDNAYNAWQRTCLHIEGEYWLILDALPPSMGDEESAWLGLQFDQSITVVDEDCLWHARPPADRSLLTITRPLDGGNSTMLHGSMEPLGGWVSPRYGERRPATQIRIPVSRATGAHCLFISANDHHHVKFVKNKHSLDGNWFLHIQTGARNDRIIYRRGKFDSSAAKHDGICFIGRLLWVRTNNGQIENLRCLEASVVEWPGQSLKIWTKSRLPSDYRHDEKSTTSVNWFDCFN
jgi:hypothetical protein